VRSRNRVLQCKPPRRHLLLFLRLWPFRLSLEPVFWSMELNPTVKHPTIADYARRFDLRVLAETGTYLGHDRRNNEPLSTLTLGKKPYIFFSLVQRSAPAILS
jgi:hypothetical protein